jgi:bifunctional non-homologous end joining protein LigD
MGLKEYTDKRRFRKTPEPEPGPAREEREFVFVVQKHAARALHYDIRLEMEGVLKSWACPKGPSLDPGVRRLAIMVEDHPFDYRNFEGVIPEGNYGAGGVIVWDRGVYRHPDARDRGENQRLVLEGLRKGDLKFILLGEKLKGEFALVKSGKDRQSWFLLKKKDRYASGSDILAENRSVVSGRTLEELMAEAPHTRSGNGKIERMRRMEALEGKELQDAPLSPMPHRIMPMLATPANEPFDHPDWLFEVKWDGYRAIAEVGDKKVELYSRNLLPLGTKFSAIVEALRGLPFQAVLDGEIVALNDLGVPDFQLLQNYRKSGQGHLVYYLFDLLFFQGHDLTALPLIRRKELLKRILPSSTRIRVSEHIKGEGLLFFRVIREKGVEGIIAKHAQSLYRIGTRSREWLKLKRQLSQEGVIAGFTAPRGGRRYFGTLVLGAFEGGELVHIGHAGGGFTTDELQQIHERLLPLVQPTCPFATEPTTNAPATWVRPELVAEVTFSGWTEELIMRHPVFLRMRDDKAPRDVVREKVGEGGRP